MLDTADVSNTPNSSHSESKYWETTVLVQPPFTVPSQPKPRGKFVDHFRKATRAKSSLRAKSSVAKKPMPLRQRHPNLPELVHDTTVSEESTPVSTPIHPEFNFRGTQGSIENKAGRGLASYGCLPPVPSPLAGRSRHQDDEDSKVWFTTPCPPPAPRVDTGSFDTSYQDFSFDSSASLSFSSMDAPIPFLAPPMERPILPSLEREQLHGSRIITAEDPRLVVCPSAPRPDTGAWTHNMDVNGLTKPGPFLPGIPTWMLNVPRQSSCRLLPPRSSIVSSTWPRPSPNWNTGLGLNLDAIADIPGPGLGENEYTRGDLECELCLAELFPSIPRAPRGCGCVGETFCSVPAAPTGWSTTAHPGPDSGRRFGVGLGRGLHPNEADRRFASHGRADGYGSMALGYEHGPRSMRRFDSAHHDQSQPQPAQEQSVWTRPVEPIALSEGAYQNSTPVFNYNGVLLPPFEFGRCRVGI